MDNQEKPSKWDELARELGAEAPPEPVIAPKSTYVTESEPAEPRRKTVEPPPRPKPNPPSWDSLAADFGLEVPPPIPSTSAQTPVEPSPPPRSEEWPPRRPRPPRREESAAAEDRPARPPRHQREEPPRRQREERPRRDREDSPRRDREDSSRHSRDESPRRSREESPRRERDEPPRPTRDEPSPAPAPPQAELESKPASNLGVSLWHKIFGSPDQQAERIADSAADAARHRESKHARDDQQRDDQQRDDQQRDERRDRSGRRREGPPTDRDTVGAAEASESWGQEAAKADVVETGEAEGRADQPTDENGEPRRRRRRGRGRGRGRRPDGEPGGEEQPTESRADRPREPSEPRAPRAPREPREEREPRGRSGRSARPRREVARKQDDVGDDFDDGLEEIVLDDDNDEMDLGIDGEDATESTGREAPAGHKSIPSWDDAIGIIVDTNLSTRTDRRRSAPPQSRGSGNPRGRSRGGRRRKSS